MTYRCHILAACIALLSLPIGSSAMLAQPLPEALPIPESNTSSLRQLIRRIFRDDQRDDPPTISRGELCLLSPARSGQERRLWHHQPVFIWQGTIGKMAVLDADTDSVVWAYEPTAGETYVRYQGEPLQAGREYRWQLFETSESASPTVFPPFQILPPANRALLANGLSVAENQADSTNGSDAIARAQYFISRDLPVDALQSLFLIESPTEDLIEARQEAVEMLCQ